MVSPLQSDSWISCDPHPTRQWVISHRFCRDLERFCERKCLENSYPTNRWLMGRLAGSASRCGYRGWSVHAPSALRHHLWKDIWVGLANQFFFLRILAMTVIHPGEVRSRFPPFRLDTFLRNNAGSSQQVAGGPNLRL